MRIGIGLPAAVPSVDATTLGDWAARSEHRGFCSLGVIDRLVYDNLDPLIALAAAAARTERVELLTTVLNVAWRRNAVALAKQLASLDHISGGRLTAGLGFGGWPQDHEVSGVPISGRGALFDEMLATMRRVWDGGVSGASGPIPPHPPGRPRLLIGGFVPASFRRVAAIGEGWVGPSFGFEPLVTGVAAAEDAWAQAGRSGHPRIVAERYFCFGDAADEIAGHYLMHYYGHGYVAAVRADTIIRRQHLHTELSRLRDAGCDDLILLPCSHDAQQVDLLAAALDHIGITGDAAQGRVLGNSM